MNDEPQDDGTTDPPRAAGPRIRWAGVIWGLAFAAAGILALKTLLTAAGRDAVFAWTVHLSALQAVAGGFLAVGALLLLAGLVGLAHRLQRRFADR